MNTSLKVEVHVFHVCDIPSTDRPFEIEMKLLKNCFPFSLRFRAVFEPFSVQGRDKGCTGWQRQAIVVPLLEWDWAFPVSIEIFQALFMSKCSFTNSTKHLLNTTSRKKEIKPMSTYSVSLLINGPFKMGLKNFIWFYSRMYSGIFDWKS